MKQAQISAWGEPPKYIDVPAPGPPSPDEVQLKVLATGLHQLVRGRAAGTHYSAKGLPHIPGVDGVGVTFEGQLKYFNAITPTGGSFAETINVPVKMTKPIPDGADPVQVALLMNPVMASWMALSARTSGLEHGFTAVVVGATGLSGSSAVDVARIFGAGKVVGVARDTVKMAGLRLDATIAIAEEDPASADFGAAMEADVVLDFLWGPVALALLKALKPTKPVQYVQIGTMAGRTFDFPGDILRSKDITIRGTGPGAWSMQSYAKESLGMIEAITSGKIRPGKFQEVKLQDIEIAWSQKGGVRVVVTP